MAKKGIRAGKSHKNQYKAYSNNNSFEYNKIAKLERTVKKQPNNLMAKEALKKAVKSGCTYSRNNKSAHPCKGRSTAFGWEDNKAPKKSYKVVFSYIWHVSRNFSNWFLPSCGDQLKTANNAKTIRQQLINLGFTPPYGKSNKKTSR